MSRRAPLAPALAALLLAAACHPPDAGRPDFVAAAYLRLVAAEDARPAGGPDLTLLVRGTRSPSPVLRAVAVRGIGRLERPELVDALTPMLADPEPMVRREAANALAQAVHRTDGARALEPLLRSAEADPDPTVRGVVGRALGRLSLHPSARLEVARQLVALSRAEGGDAPPLQMEGVVLGMASFVAAGGDQPVPPVLRIRLAELTRYGVAAPAGDEGAVRVRAAAVLAHTALDPSAETVGRLLGDRAAPVRRVAASRLAALPEGERLTLAARALTDTASQVRLEAVRRGVAPPPLSAAACSVLLEVADEEPDPHVRLAALDALASPCPDRTTQVARLRARADRLPASGPAWHEPARALASLAALAPDAAIPALPAAASHPDPFARTWVAIAAARAGDTGLLRSLAGDISPNVRTEALRGLAATEGRGADDALVRALEESDDNQLLLTAAALLSGSSADGVVEAALGALERISAPGWETLRDARVALLDLVAAAGDGTRVPGVEPYLRDYDPAVARRAAGVLLAWTGKRWIDAPRGSPPPPPPPPDELAAMERATLVFHMARGGAVEVRLFPWQAPTNAVRLYRMAREGVLDGLTLHRVVPNFVVQGGSPGANEYAGHGAYTRDEVGLVPNWRGTVGLSTRGRDTGDGQIYVNLVDNLRLDHDYTLFGAVSGGMEVVDAVLEGDVIARVEVRDRGPVANGPA